MRLWASSLVNVSVHGRKRERRGEWEGDGKIEKKNKQHGKYSKAHAWVLTKCKWKGKSPHQHTATQGGSQDAFTLFSPPLSSPFHHLIAPPLPPPCIILNVSFFFFQWLVALKTFVSNCLITTRGKQCVRALKSRDPVLCAHPSWAEAVYSPGFP